MTEKEKAAPKFGGWLLFIIAIALIVVPVGIALNEKAAYVEGLHSPFNACLNGCYWATKDLPPDNGLSPPEWSYCFNQCVEEYNAK